MNMFAELRKLREENARLKELLTRHGIAWDNSRPLDQTVPSTEKEQPVPSKFSVAEKIALFRQLFSGRQDVYPRRWESATRGTSGYTPVCGNEWKRGVCGKPKIKCADCPERNLLPVTDQVFYDHLSGRHTIGVYPLRKDDSCRFLAVDFDEADWRNDSRAFLRSCRDTNIPAALEISRSGEGAHIWIFFSEPVPAKEARQLGAALLSRTCENTRQLSLASYDRLFPNQDTLPRGGFGNLIALPLQKQPRGCGHSVFVDEQFQPYPDQWDFLASIRPLSRQALGDAILHACGGRHPLDVAFVEDEDDSCPWQRPAPRSARLPGTLPRSLHLVLANQIFIAKDILTQPLANRLIRLAAFQNPEFYRTQAMRLPVWNKPRIIGCAENHPRHIGLPRGCLDALLGLLRANNIQAEIQDERISGQSLSVQFTGTLREDQHEAIEKMLAHDIGVLCAPTAFGKTVTASAIIAQRKVSTLVLVHRTELLHQWLERLNTFLDIQGGEIGFMGGGRNKLSGKIDIAVMQSLSPNADQHSILDRYGQVIVDECHHLSAFSFETLLKQAKARFVLGLTATPIRRDGHHPIIVMQCGPIRHRATRPENTPSLLEVRPVTLPSPELSRDAPIQEVFRALAGSVARNLHIADDILAAYREGRKVLALTERTDHLPLLHEILGDKVERCFMLHGRLSKKQRQSVLDALNSLDESASRVLLATGRLIGEGFDHPPLDTLVLAMPISWKGTLQQYAGRLHRYHADKNDVRIYDYVEQDHPQLARMWNKRLRGYQSMGYTVSSCP